MSECFNEQCPRIAKYNNPETGQPKGAADTLRSLGASAVVGMGLCPGAASCMEKAWPDTTRKRPQNND